MFLLTPEVLTVIFQALQTTSDNPKGRRKPDNMLSYKSDQHVGPVCFDNFFCLTSMCKCFIFYKKNIRNFDIWIVKKHSNSNSMLANTLVCTANRNNFSPFLQICWPTFLNFLRNFWPKFFLNFFLCLHVRAQSKPDQHGGQLMLVEMLANLLSGLRPP